MINKPKQSVEDVVYPTTTLADIFWDDLVAKDPEGMRQWVKPSSAKKPTITEGNATEQ